jgi:hypothetical protein
LPVVGRDFYQGFALKQNTMAKKSSETMKTIYFYLIALFSLSTFSVNAQTAAGISDDDLKKYALTMDSVKVMQETLQSIIAETVQTNKVMTVARYNQLFKVAGDEAKLNDANPTAEERAFLQEIADLRQYNIARINATYQALAKEYIGLKAFNAIKKSLETDDRLKQRYERINGEVQSSRQAELQKG